MLMAQLSTLRAVLRSRQQAHTGVSGSNAAGGTGGVESDTTAELMEALKEALASFPEQVTSESPTHIDVRCYHWMCDVSGTFPCMRAMMPAHHRINYTANYTTARALTLFCTCYRAPFPHSVSLT